MIRVALGVGFIVCFALPVGIGLSIADGTFMADKPRGSSDAAA